VATHSLVPDCHQDLVQDIGNSQQNAQQDPFPEQQCGHPSSEDDQLDDQTQRSEVDPSSGRDDERPNRGDDQRQAYRNGDPGR
jgi:hypothetical protein